MNDLRPSLSGRDYCAPEVFQLERVQKGVSSRAFTHGVDAREDERPFEFDRRYLALRD